MTKQRPKRDELSMADKIMLFVGACGIWLVIVAFVLSVAPANEQQSAKPPRCEPCKEPLPAITQVVTCEPTSTTQPTSTPTSTPTATSTPPATATPEYVSPNLSQYTQTTFIVWPQTRTVGIGYPFADDVFLADRDGVEAVEMHIVYNPVVLTVITATVADNSVCGGWSVNISPPLIYMQCEITAIASSGRLFNVTFIGSAEGTSIIDTAGEYGTFVGAANGWSFNPDVNGAWVVVE